MFSKINFSLNGNDFDEIVEDSWSLLYFLRRKLFLLGTKEGCGTGECGACTVLVDNKSVNSCIYLAVEINNKRVITIEGISSKNGGLSKIQRSFIDHFGIQCGFCTPGLIMASEALYKEKENISVEEIKHSLSGNLCRCSGYIQIIESVQSVFKY